MSKLTLNVDEEVVLAAKEYAKEQGTSISSMVEVFLRSVVAKDKESAKLPVLTSIRGILRNADIKDYKRHIEAKYSR